MPRFHYKAIDSNGELTSGEIEAVDVAGATARLEADGLKVESVEPIDVSSFGDSATEEIDSAGRTVERMKVRDFRRLSGQLGDLTEAGLPLVQGLSALAAELPSSRFRRGLRSIVSRLQAGGELGSVLKSHGAPADLQALIAAGAKSGHTGELLGRYAAQARQVSDIRFRAAIALVYPLIILLLLGVVLVAIMVGLVPSFRKIFEDFGTELPAITKLVISTSDVLVSHGIWLFGAMIFMVSAIWVVVAFVLDKMTRRRIICAIPVLGRLLRFSALARFSHLLAILVENGVPLPEALVLSGDSAGDAEIQAASWMMASDVESGEPLDRAAYNMPAMPGTLVESMKWHDKPDVFADTLRALTEMYKSRAHAQTGLITVLWQPIIMVTMGISVGLIVIALFMPLIKLLNDLS
ncbi:MAG: type II secretion system F family protein [Planctomycetaceae bacterium]|jgi:type II secretory pathway component PulF|nr:type II secretion system F family protein [Planctomycetaceae bacterium]MBT6483584.1 type II secretion system F family protein [Planctomycetaceae bacterium]MBT6493097.1 type II secretion system F family protein [Planctomycetaceae bacterium]